MRHVVIPHIQSAWGEELRYTLRSWDLHFAEPFDVTIIGTLPTWIKNVNHIPEVTDEIKQTVDASHFDQYGISHWITYYNENFIWSNDDIYLLKPCSLKEIDKPYYLQDLNSLKRPKNPRIWLQRLWNTYDRCKQLNLQGYNYETHLPYYYRVSAMKETFRKFSNLTKWCVNTAYQNLYVDANSIDPTYVGIVKDGSYTPDTKLYVKPTSIFFNHNDNGLHTKVKLFLQDKFRYPSRFERT